MWVTGAEYSIAHFLVSYTNCESTVNIESLLEAVILEFESVDQMHAIDCLKLLLGWCIRH